VVGPSERVYPESTQKASKGDRDAFMKFCEPKEKSPLPERGQPRCKGEMRSMNTLQTQIQHAGQLSRVSRFDLFTEAAQ
jgi:hypothetical protein